TDDVIAEHVGGRGHLVLLYRIVLEAITNARKHSCGTRIRVRLRMVAPGTIEIAISDNGSAPDGPFKASVGMALMRQRAEEIGATIEHAAAPEGGTAVMVRLLRPDLANGPDADAAAPGSRPAAGGVVTGGGL